MWLYRRQWTVQSGATIVYIKCKHNSAPWIEQIVDVYITYLILDRWDGGLINVLATRWHCVSKANSRCNIGQTWLLLLLLEHMMMSEDNSWRSHYLNFADIEWTSPQQVEKWPHGNIFEILSQVQFPLPVINNINKFKIKKIY